MMVHRELILNLHLKEPPWKGLSCPKVVSWFWLRGAATSGDLAETDSDDGMWRLSQSSRHSRNRLDIKWHLFWAREHSAAPLLAAHRSSLTWKNPLEKLKSPKNRWPWLWGTASGLVELLHVLVVLNLLALETTHLAVISYTHVNVNIDIMYIYILWYMYIYIDHYRSPWS